MNEKWSADSTSRYMDETLNKLYSQMKELETKLASHIEAVTNHRMIAEAERRRSKSHDSVS